MVKSSSKKWTCSSCGNEVRGSQPPENCPISCCNGYRTYTDQGPAPIVRYNWQCDQCGAFSPSIIQPTVCHINCCGATNSYVPYHEH